MISYPTKLDDASLEALIIEIGGGSPPIVATGNTQNISVDIPTGVTELDVTFPVNFVGVPTKANLAVIKASAEDDNVIIGGYSDITVAGFKVIFAGETTSTGSKLTGTFSL